jgi:hypothetical protein
MIQLHQIKATAWSRRIECTYGLFVQVSFLPIFGSISSNSRMIAAVSSAVEALKLKILTLFCP